nr:retrovirus-related Pol polyprotein from transposon TNT 1-94 [Tanacetum cinerariifolium]
IQALLLDAGLLASVVDFIHVDRGMESWFQRNLGYVLMITNWILKGIQSHEMFVLLQLINYVEKFIGTVRFKNDQFAKIIGYGDYKPGDTIILRVYYVEGLNHNLFSVEQFFDGGLEVAFRQHTCHIRNMDKADLLQGSRSINLSSILLNDMLSASPVCLLMKASSTKSWLWHRRLNHLNFKTLNELTRKDFVRGLQLLKYDKDRLCPSCQLGKSKKASHPIKMENTNVEVLSTLHMDLCGLMRTESINKKKYVLNTQRALNATVCTVRTDNGTEFVNKTLTNLFESVGITHQTSVPRSSQQNGVVERRNRTLMEAACIMLIFAKAPLFLWAEDVATACYTLNRSLIHTLHRKTYYELLKGKKPYLKYFRVFGSLCYPTNDNDDVGKLKAKADIGLGPNSMTSVQNSTGLELKALQSGRTSSDIVKDPPTPSTKDHPLDNVIGDVQRLVSTRKQLQTDVMWCFFNEFISHVEPKNYKQALEHSCWIEAMQEEIQVRMS